MATDVQIDKLRILWLKPPGWLFYLTDAQCELNSRMNPANQNSVFEECGPTRARDIVA
jgi:hypothetical protein